ncbi:hypothetical protein D3C87_1397670 [compost metagenome]
MNGGENPSDLRITHRRNPAIRIAAAVFDPGANDRRRQDIRQPCQNAAGADPIHIHLARHGIQKMRNGRLAGCKVAGQHRFGHELQKRMQPVYIEAHRRGQRHRAATCIGALHVEYALTDLLLAVTPERQRLDSLGTRYHMGVTARQYDGISGIQLQPFA